MSPRQTLVAPHIRYVAYAWLGYFAMLLALPVRYGRLESTQTLAALLTFATLSIVVALAVDWCSRVGAGTTHSLPALVEVMHPASLRRLVLTSMALGMAGFLALVFDKIFVQHIDFTQGIAVARYLWRNEAEARSGGVSSVFSVAGYLFGFTFFVTAALSHLHWEALTPAIRRLALASVVFLVMANSFLTGGRSIILVQLAAVFVTGGIRVMGGRKFFPGKSLRSLAWAAAIGVGAIGYSIYVFSERATANGVDPGTYAVGMLRYLGGEPTEGFNAMDALPDGIAGVAQFFVIAGAYLTHSFGTLESLLTMDSTPGNASFVFARVLLARFGLLESADEQWILTGRFPTLPGALWYDFGWTGILLGGACTGFLLGLVRPILTMRPAGIVIGASIAVVITALLAPLLLAPDLLAFPFMIVGFAIMDGIAYAFGIRCSWLPAGRSYCSYFRRCPES